MPAPSPRVPAPCARLIAPRSALAACVCAYIARSTLGTTRPGYNHYPATPLCSVVWTLAGATVMVDNATSAHGDVFEAGTAVFHGPQQQPWSTYNPGPAHFFIALLYPDALHALTGLDMAAWVGKSVPAAAVPGVPWQTLTAALSGASSDAGRAILVDDFLDARWREASGLAAPERGMLGDWIRRLARQAAASGIGRSARMAERRIKSSAGLSLRTLRRMGRAEQALLAARADLGAGKISWGDVAADTGYADQSHLTRETRAMTGLSPGALAHLVEHDDSYWLYDIWS